MLWRNITVLFCSVLFCSEQQNRTKHNIIPEGCLLYLHDNATQDLVLLIKACISSSPTTPVAPQHCLCKRLAKWMAP